MSGIKVSVFASYTGWRHLQQGVLFDSVGMKNGIHGAESSGGSHGGRPAFPNRLPAPLSLSLAGIDPFPNGNVSTNINNKRVFQPSWQPDAGKAPGSGPPTFPVWEQASLERGSCPGTRASPHHAGPCSGADSLVQNISLQPHRKVCDVPNIPSLQLRTLPNSWKKYAVVSR